MKGPRILHTLIASFSLLGTVPAETAGQYFGQNKVQYQTFEFEVVGTEHFDIYTYAPDAPATEMVAQMAERWYTRLSEVLDHELDGRQAIILYQSHPHFRQTNAISGEIGESTGGVTEAFKRRIVLPMAGPLEATDHVLGHELVHAFQFDITTQRTSSGAFQLPGALRLPLWFMEGMAEYLSLGSEDTHTAMWLRDAMLEDDLPAVSDLDDPEYFPYRFGQAFWAYVAGRWGDQVAGEILRAAGTAGTPESAIRNVLGIEPQALSENWHAAIREQYAGVLDRTEAPEAFGRLILDEENETLEISPSLSPDGSRVAFFSERDLFSVDMFVADVRTGEILGKVTDSAVDPHLESLQFIQSAGAWSADGDRFAYGAIVTGEARIRITDTNSFDHVLWLPLSGIDEVLNPAWSPNGQRIVFSAVAGGLTDLFVVDVETGVVERLTDDAYAAVHPAWSPDGSTIAFVTDRFTSDAPNRSYRGYQIGLLDVTSGEVTRLPTPGGSRTTSPQWSGDGSRVFYVADAGGIRNVYATAVDTGATIALTNVQTGVSGITTLSPALAASRNDDLVYNVFEGGAYSLYALEMPRSVETTRVSEFQETASLLPPGGPGSVASYLAEPNRGLRPRATEFIRDYDPALSLDYVAPPNVSVGMSNFGTFVGSGTAIYWSDMLGNHNLVTAMELNTDGSNFVRDFAGLVGYENRTRRWDWSLTAGQNPFRSAGIGLAAETVDGQPVVIERFQRYWEIHRDVTGAMRFPFNRAARVEFSAGFRNISFAAEEEIRAFDLVTGQQISFEEDELSTPDPIRMAVASAAYVHDQSVPGPTGPVRGRRFRLEASPTFGGIQQTTALVDFRQYAMPVRPLTLALRVLHFGRYGSDAEDPRLRQLFLGDDGLVRGYGVTSFDGSDCARLSVGSCAVIDQLIGSRIAVANLEARLPLFGPLGVVARGLLPVDAAVFFDVGSAWLSGDRPDWLGGDAPAVSSHGVSLRANLFGALAAQVNLVHPNDRPSRNWVWEFRLAQAF